MIRRHVWTESAHWIHATATVGVYTCECAIRNQRQTQRTNERTNDHMKHTHKKTYRKKQRMFKFWCSGLCDTKIKLNKYTLHSYVEWGEPKRDREEEETEERRGEHRIEKHIIYNTLIDVSFRRCSRLVPCLDQHFHSCSRTLTRKQNIHEIAVFKKIEKWSEKKETRICGNGQTENYTIRNGNNNNVAGAAAAAATSRLAIGREKRKRTLYDLHTAYTIN